MRNFNLTKAIIPNSFTSLNAFCGFLSIIYSSKGEFEIAVYLIFAAALFDAFDGILARLVGSSSRFGVELDSLSDIISFGAAPSLLVYFFYLSGFGWIGIFFSAWILIFGAFRLARFNVQLEDLNSKSDFKGLPIPIAALTITSFVYAHINNSDSAIFTYIIIGLIVILSFLMVSQIKYDTLPKIYKQSPKERLLTSVISIVCGILIYITDGIALFYIFLSIVIFGILRKLISYFFDSRNNEETNLNEETN